MIKLLENDKEINRCKNNLKNNEKEKINIFVLSKTVYTCIIIE